ncbi:MAG: SurA N-terminal domain-containing protein [Myxococcota bacterium]
MNIKALSLVCAVIPAIFFTACSSAEDPAAEASQPSAIVARVGDHTVTAAHVDAARRSMEASGEKMSNQQAAQRALENEIRVAVLEQEARARGLEATREQAEQYAAEVQRRIRDDAAIHAQYTEAVQQSGLSEEEYARATVSTYQSMLSVMNLEEALAREFGEDGVASAVDRLVEKAKVEIVASAHLSE